MGEGHGGGFGGGGGGQRCLLFGTQLRFLHLFEHFVF